MSTPSRPSDWMDGTRWVWIVLWACVVALMFHLSLQTPYVVEIGDRFSMCQESRSLLDLKAPKGQKSQGDLCWVLAYDTHPDIGMSYGLVKDVWQHSAPIFGKVYGTSGEGYFIASRYSIVDPESSVQSFDDEAVWRSRVASLTGSGDIELITPDRRQSAGFWKTQGSLSAFGLVGFVVVYVLTRKRTKTAV